jgi:small subunit ribosomal protein S16
MLVIRMARGGRNKYPVYRIVAAEQSRAVTGKFVAVLGHYNPHTKDLILNKEDILKYIGNGAQPSNAVVKLLKREKVELPAWAALKTKNKKSKQEPTEAPAAKEEAPTQEVAEEKEEAAK